VEISVSLEAGHTRIASIGSRRRVRTYPSHSSILYTLHPKHAGCEYPNDMSWREWFQASTMVCRHQVKYVWSNTCGGAEREGVDRRSRSETLEQSGADQNNGNKNRKRCDIIAVVSTLYHLHLVTFVADLQRKASLFSWVMSRLCSFPYSIEFQH
jgi:hypothetical protein